MQLESIFQRCCLIVCVKSSTYSSSQPENILDAIWPLCANLNRLPLWLICEMWQRHLVLDVFQGHHMAGFSPMFLISFLVSYSTPFSLFQVLLSGVRGRPTEQVGLQGDSWAFLLEQTQHGLHYFRITSLSYWTLSMENCGCGEHGLSPFYEDHFPESVCIFVFFCSCPSFSHHSLSFFSTTGHYEKPWFSLYFTWMCSL